MGRRGWRKLHLGVDQSGVIRVHTLTEATGDDATTGLSGSRRTRRRARASVIGCEMGRIRSTNVFERAGESRMTPPASSISSQVRPRISFLRQLE